MREIDFLEEIGLVEEGDFPEEAGFPEKGDFPEEGEIDVEFLKKFFGGGSRDSARTARDRLRIVLIHDRTDISPQLLENLRMEMIEVLTRYMDIDTNKIELDLDRDDQSVALVANIPVLRVKRGAALEEDDSPSRPEAGFDGDRSGRKRRRQA